MTSTTADALIDRLAKARQDARTTFGETVQVAPGVTETRTLHSPGPEARREYDAANLAVQERANALVAEGDHDSAWTLLVFAAEAQMAKYPQYRGKWNDHRLGVMRRQWRGKGGVRALRGDAVLVGPEGEYPSLGPAPDYEPRTVTYTSVRAARTDCDFAAEPTSVRVLS